jgi:CubicO group peptidase (beta-lactamase class C family)
MIFSSRIRSGTIAMLALLVCLSAPSRAQVAGGLATAKEIHDMLVLHIDVQHQSDGIVVGVITKKAREIISYGHFDGEDVRVPNADTVFEIGSITKVFTSLLLSEMVLDGEVKLSDPASKYLPVSVHMPTRNGKQITLLDLATHHSGLPKMPTNFNWQYTNEQMYDFLSHYQLTRDPGEKYEYSNLGAALLGHILALRAGTDYGTLLHTRITGPLHMTRTGVDMTPEMSADFTPGHNYGLKKAQPWHVPTLAGGGDIRSSVNDLLIFLAANMGIMHSPLRPAMKEMLSVHRSAAPGVQVALGWHIEKGRDDVISHGGVTNGYTGYMGYDPHRKIGVVILSNSSNSIDDIFWRTFNYPVSGLDEQRVGPSNLPH